MRSLSLERFHTTKLDGWLRSFSQTWFPAENLCHSTSSHRKAALDAENRGVAGENRGGGVISLYFNCKSESFLLNMKRPWGSINEYLSPFPPPLLSFSACLHSSLYSSTSYFLFGSTALVLCSNVWNYLALKCCKIWIIWSIAITCKYIHCILYRVDKIRDLHFNKQNCSGKKNKVSETWIASF